MAQNDAAAAAYKKIQLTEQLRDELLTAFRKHSALRAKRVDLERQLEKLVAKIKERDQVAEILAKPIYKDIEVRHHRDWLRDIEEEVASTYKAAKKKQATTLASKIGKAKERRRESTSAKLLRLIDTLEKCGKEAMTQKELAELLELPTAQVGAWLKPLGLKNGCIVDVQKGNRRLGKKIMVNEVLNSLKVMS